MSQSEFRALYDAYVTSVSSPAMALSWESLAAIDRWLRLDEPVRMIEYGSGISTVLLASYAKERGGVVESVDSEPEWATRTQAFLEEHGLGAWAVVSSAEEVAPTEPAPFVLWDFDKNPKRVVLMAKAFENVSANGLMYVDDMHSQEIAEACAALVGEIVEETPRDGFGRYGVFVRKPAR